MNSMRSNSKSVLACVISIICLYSGGHGQNSTFKGWFFSSHEQKLLGRWSLLSDIQLRSADQFSYVETILLRPGIIYNFTDQQSVAAGYAFLGQWTYDNGEKKFEAEHRVWEQYVVEIAKAKSAFTSRFRLEQRFLQNERGHDFAQRFRYYFRLQLFLKNQEIVKKGSYCAFQNEIFLNIHNKENINGKFFDENRATVSIGYRLSDAVELEVGYLYRYQIEKEKIHNHILQVMLTTKL